MGRGRKKEGDPDALGRQGGDIVDERDRDKEAPRS